MLNFCNSAPQADALVDLFAPLAIGMRGAVDDVDAITFATQLYATIAEGHSVASAHASGRAAVELLGGEYERPHLAVAADVDPTAVRLVVPPGTEGLQ